MQKLESAAIALALPQEISREVLLEKYAKAGEHQHRGSAAPRRTRAGRSRAPKHAHAAMGGVPAGRKTASSRRPHRFSAPAPGSRPR